MLHSLDATLSLPRSLFFQTTKPFDPKTSLSPFHPLPLLTLFGEFPSIRFSGVKPHLQNTVPTSLHNHTSPLLLHSSAALSCPVLRTPLCASILFRSFAYITQGPCSAGTTTTSQPRRHWWRLIHIFYVICETTLFLVQITFYPGHLLWWPFRAPSPRFLQVNFTSFFK